MRRIAPIAMTVLVTVLATPALAQQRMDSNGNGSLDLLISKHASTYGVPESLIRRVIRRESRGNPRVVSKGNFGLMQIKLATARGMGYQGSAAGLLDADTNMTYAVKYLAGAYKVAGGNESRAVALYAGGYYYAAKSRGMLAQVDPNAGLSGAKTAELMASAHASASAREAGLQPAVNIDRQSAYTP
jgi:soluble lytic murein transglycosylase-like protein